MDASPHPFQHYLDRFAPLVDHVRQNPSGDLSVEGLARVVHLSPFHFHRLFTAVMGETVATFVQRVRLERAAQLMKTTPRRSLSEVANAAGFGSLSAFSRAFRRAYGVAPSRWDRRARLTFRAEERGSGHPAENVPDLDQLLAAGEGPPVTVELRDVAPRTLAYVRIVRPWEPGALERGYNQLREWLRGHGLEERQLLGISWDDVEVTPPELIRYDLAASVPQDVTGGRGMAVRAWPSFRVAASAVQGTLARVAGVWDHLYNDWLPRSRFEPDDFPPFEWYHDWPRTLESDQWQLDCCIPVKTMRFGARRP